MLSVVADVERVLGDAADELRREDWQLRSERIRERVEVVALVSLEAAGGPDFLYVRNVRPRGESCAGAEKNRVGPTVPLYSSVISLSLPGLIVIRLRRRPQTPQ